MNTMRRSTFPVVNSNHLNSTKVDHNVAERRIIKRDIVHVKKELKSLHLSTQVVIDESLEEINILQNSASQSREALKEVEATLRTAQMRVIALRKKIRKLKKEKKRKNAKNGELNNQSTTITNMIRKSLSVPNFMSNFLSNDNANLWSGDVKENPKNGNMKNSKKPTKSSSKNSLVALESIIEEVTIELEKDESHTIMRSKKNIKNSISCPVLDLISIDEPPSITTSGFDDSDSDFFFYESESVGASSYGHNSSKCLQEYSEPTRFDTMDYQSHQHISNHDSSNLEEYSEPIRFDAVDYQHHHKSNHDSSDLEEYSEPVRFDAVDYENHNTSNHDTPDLQEYSEPVRFDTMDHQKHLKSNPDNSEDLHTFKEKISTSLPYGVKEVVDEGNVSSHGELLVDFKRSRVIPRRIKDMEMQLKSKDEKISQLEKSLQDALSMIQRNQE